MMTNEELKEAISFAYERADSCDYSSYGSKSIAEKSKLMLTHLESLILIQLDRAKGGKDE